MNVSWTTAIIAGLGNIGSYCAELVARSRLVSRMLLIDRDTYEPDNLSKQAIAPGDFGVAKAVAQARRLRRIAPGLTVEAVVAAVEALPLGALRSAVVFGCLDSRRARQTLGEACWHLGVPYIDAGVLADSLLARVSIYWPEASPVCPFCTWDQSDFDLIEQEYPCRGGATPASTNAPAYLGALAAAWQITEALKLGAGDLSLAGSQVIIDANSRMTFVAGAQPSPSCRFPHETWNIESTSLDPRSVRFAELFDHLDAQAIRVAGQDFVRQLACGGCGCLRHALRLAPRVQRQPPCRCGDTFSETSIGLTDWLARADLEPQVLRRTLASAGIRSHDILEVRPSSGTAASRFLELVSPAAVR